MGHLDDVSTDDLRTALEVVEEKTPALRLVAAIANKEGVTQQELADWFGVERKTIYNWLTRIDPDDIPNSVRDEPRPGRPRKLDPEQQAALANALENPPSESDVDADADEWTAPALQHYIEDRFGVEYSLPSCRRLLAELDA